MFEPRRSDLALDTGRILRSALLAMALCAVAGAIAAYLDDGDNFFLFLVGAAIVAAVVRRMLADRQRNREMRKVAEALGFTYVGSALPASFSFLERAFDDGHGIRNVCVSDIPGREIVFFDCDVGHGKGRRRRSVVAVRGSRARFGSALLLPDVSTEEMAGWSIVCGSSRLLEIAEITSLISEALVVRRDPTR